MSLRVLRLWRGCGGDFPRYAARSAALCYPCLAGWRHPVRRSGEVVRGGSWNTHRDNARCAYRNRNHPGNRNDNTGFRVVLRSSHVLQPLLLVPPRGGTVRRQIRAGRVPEMPADPRQLVGWAELAKPNSPSGSARSRTCDLLGFVPQPNLRH
ncbi:MAG: SUMF1/EgtB/PvdO family nonheme iron enzyme [Candidatus Accumulibacter sp.]|uniref:SUMF1/EgtB/PvdO family nonheme iron enzyme n=1 Tax=Candidatus Accumulibacter affinis TaxID=2954384 RepID=A0A935W5S5_9PROT|nr:SUMF1/EgtB/PvdO family nonheme iron enzyme [Candidatus Accumulibacter affinis]